MRVVHVAANHTGLGQLDPAKRVMKKGPGDDT